MEEEIYYTTPNGTKISQAEALQEYGDELFDQLVNEGQLIEFMEEENPALNQSGLFYESPKGDVYTEGDLINELGADVFQGLVSDGQLKKKDSPQSLSTFSNTDSALEATSKLPVSEGINSGEVDYFQGAFGDVLRGLDTINPLGLGDFIDDMARSIDAGFQNGTIAESGNDLLYGGSTASYEDIQEFIQKTEGARNLGPSDEMQDYTRIYNEEKARGLSAFGVLKGLILNPTVLPEILASSFAAMANPDSSAAAGTIIGGGAAVGSLGAGVGAIAGAAATLPYAFAAAGTVLETGLTFGELLQAKLEERNLELTNDNVQKMLNNPEILDELRFDAIARGLAIGAIDAFTGRIGGKVAAPLLKQAGKAGKRAASKALKRKAIGRAAGVEGVGGSIGETAGITATNIYGDTGQDYDTGEILLEGIAEMPGSVKDIIAVRYQKPKYKINGKKATVEEIDAVIEGMTYEQLTAPNFKIQIDNDFNGRAELLQEKIVKGRTRQAVAAANPELNDPTLERIVELEREVSIQEGKTLGTVTGKKKIADLKAEIVKLQENQLEAEAVSETDAVLDEDGNPVEGEVEGEVQGEEVNTLEQFDTLSQEEKIEYLDEAEQVLLAEAEASDNVDIDITEEQINQRASELLQEDVSSLEGDLEGDAFFDVDATDSEVIQEEMNTELPQSEVNFEATTEGGGVTVNPFEDSNSTEEFTDADAVEMGLESKEKAVQPIENLNGIPMITGISDTAAGGTVKDSKGIIPRFELGDSIVDFIKQARAQGIKESAIKVALLKRGVDPADYVVKLKESKAKASPKVEMGNAYAKGFDRVMKEINGIVKKIKARNVKGDTNPNVILKAAQKYLQGTKMYENATDVQREQMVRDLRERLGIKEKKNKSPKAAVKKSQEVIFGNFEKAETITYTVKQLWAERIRSLNRGAKSGIRAFVKAQVAIAAEVTDMVKRGVITSKQMASILRKFTSVNPLSEASIERFVDYMAKVINNAEYDSQIKRAKDLASRAKRNIARKIGVADAIKTQLEQILSIKPNMIPESVFQQYLELLEEFGASSSVLNLSQIESTTETIENIMAALDQEFSLIPELRDRFNSFGPEYSNGKIDFAATIKSMLDDESITQEEADLMKKFKADILPEAAPKAKKTEKELAKEKADTIDRILTGSVLKVSELPSRLEKTLADAFEKLYNNKTVLEALTIEDLVQIEKLIDNIQNGYLPHLVQIQVSKMQSILDGKLLSDALTVGKVPLFSSYYAKAKNLINRGKRGAITEAIRRNPLFYIDQVFGNYKGKPIFNALFNRAAIAQERYNSQMKVIFGKIEDAETAVFKSFNKDGNKTLVSKFKQMIYMIQLEHDSNLGNKEVNNASGFILKTIAKIDAGETTFSMDDAEALRKIYDDFKNDEGEIDIEKLNASFNKAELASIKTIQAINRDLGSKAVFTASVIRGDAMTPRNNYVHLSVLPDSKAEAESAPSSIARFNKSLKPSTKAKSLIERSGSTSPLNFDVYAAVSKGAKGVLLDFHLTEPIRTARRTLLQAEANLKADGTRVSTEEREKLNAVKDSFNEVVENLLQNSYTETSLGGAVVQWLQKNGYRAILASTTRWVAELSSNSAYAMITNPKAFLAGSKIGIAFLNSDAAPQVMAILGSKQTTRIYPNEDMSGRMIDSRLLQESEGLKGGRTKGRFMNKLTQIWNKTGKKYQGGVATIADGLISTPDKIVMRPMWFGSFSTAFEAITGQKPDLDKIALEDSAYMQKYSEALTQATTEADETSVMTGSTSNPFMGILKGTSKATDGVPTKVFNAFNNFMTTFLIYEYITARTGVMNAVGKGHLSKQKGAQLIAGSATRMVMYTMMANVLGEALGGLAGEEEDEKSLDKQLGQAMASTFSSLIFGRDFGNAFKSIVNLGVENFNIEFLDMLREGEYDQYKDGLAYQIIPPNKDGRGTNLGEMLTKMTASLGPAAKTLDFMIKKGTEAEKKTASSIQRREDEIFKRLPLELLGNAGFIPMYKDVRRLVLRDIYSEMRKASIENKQSKQNEINRLQGYDTRSDMKRYDPRLWQETFGPGTEIYDLEYEDKIIKSNLRKEKQRLKDEENGYSRGGSDGFGSDGFGSGGSKKRGNSSGGFGSDNSFGSQ